MVFHGGISLKRLEKIVSLKMKILLAVALLQLCLSVEAVKRPVRMRSFWKQWLKAVTGRILISSRWTRDRIFLKQKKEEPVYVHVCGQVKAAGSLFFKKKEADCMKPLIWLAALQKKVSVMH